MGMPPNAPLPMSAVAAISDIARLEPLDHYARELLELVARRLADGHDALEITSMIAQ